MRGRSLNHPPDTPQFRTLPTKLSYHLTMGDGDGPAREPCDVVEEMLLGRGYKDEAAGLECEYECPQPRTHCASITSFAVAHRSRSAGHGIFLCSRSSSPRIHATINHIVARSNSHSSPSATQAWALPDYLRHLEAAHVSEVLCHGPVPVRDISDYIGVNQSKLGASFHTHILLPDLLTTNQISSLIRVIDTSKPLHGLIPRSVYYDNTTAAFFLSPFLDLVLVLFLCTGFIYLLAPAHSLACIFCDCFEPVFLSLAILLLG
ncbi:hypothetical protein C8R44DRAFT_985642 [Mycena epipterygia]|nr:hypothetical protein C8R44DRAFT_985642 [Mycena epipterygia]